MLAVILFAAFIFLLTLSVLLATGRSTTSERLSGPTHNSAGARQGGNERSSPAAPGYYRNHSAGYWAWQFRIRTRQLQNARHVLFTHPNVVEAINLACAVYGHCTTLWRKASCETGGTYSPRSLNSSSGAAGLFQFLGSTWRSTPFGRFSIFSPYANALAAGWMHTQGRGSEWTCR